VTKLQPEAPVEEGEERQLKLVEVGLHDRTAGVAKDGNFTICVAGAAAQVGKRVKARITRVLDGIAYAELVAAEAGETEAPITAEALAEKPTRARRSRAAAAEKVEAEAVAEEEDEAVAEEDAPEGEQPKRKKTRRGSRGGRRRKKKPAVASEAAAEGDVQAEPSEDGAAPKGQVLIHVPDRELGSDAANGEASDEEQPKRKKTRRGSRGGRRRRKSSAQRESAEQPLVD
jgi:predicted RNA-binding protein with TRAM domain